MDTLAVDFGLDDEEGPKPLAYLVPTDPATVTAADDAGRDGMVAVRELIRVRDEGAERWGWPLFGGDNHLGRDSIRCDVALPTACGTVSGLHATLHVEEGASADGEAAITRVALRDANSTNGTFAKWDSMRAIDRARNGGRGPRVGKEPVDLDAGAVITLGEARLELVAAVQPGGSAAADAPVPLAATQEMGVDMSDVAGEPAEAGAGAGEGAPHATAAVEQQPPAGEAEGPAPARSSSSGGSAVGPAARTDSVAQGSDKHGEGTEAEVREASAVREPAEEQPRVRSIKDTDLEDEQPTQAAGGVGPEIAPVGKREDDGTRGDDLSSEEGETQVWGDALPGEAGMPGAPTDSSSPRSKGAGEIAGGIDGVGSSEGGASAQKPEEPAAAPPAASAGGGSGGAPAAADGDEDEATQVYHGFDGLKERPTPAVAAPVGGEEQATQIYHAAMPPPPVVAQQGGAVEGPPPAASAPVDDNEQATQVYQGEMPPPSTVAHQGGEVEASAATQVYQAEHDGEATLVPAGDDFDDDDQPTQVYAGDILALNDLQASVGGSTAPRSSSPAAPSHGGASVSPAAPRSTQQNEASSNSGGDTSSGKSTDLSHRRSEFDAPSLTLADDTLVAVSADVGTLRSPAPAVAPSTSPMTGQAARPAGDGAGRPEGKGEDVTEEILQVHTFSDDDEATMAVPFGDVGSPAAGGGAAAAGAGTPATPGADARPQVGTGEDDAHSMSSASTVPLEESDTEHGKADASPAEQSNGPESKESGDSRDRAGAAAEQAAGQGAEQATDDSKDLAIAGAEAADAAPEPTSERPQSEVPAPPAAAAQQSGADEQGDAGQPNDSPAPAPAADDGEGTGSPSPPGERDVAAPSESAATDAASGSASVGKEVAVPQDAGDAAEARQASPRSDSNAPAAAVDARSRAAPKRKRSTRSSGGPATGLQSAEKSTGDAADDDADEESASRSRRSRRTRSTRSTRLSASPTTDAGGTGAASSPSTARSSARVTRKARKAKDAASLATAGAGAASPASTTRTAARVTRRARKNEGTGKDGAAATGGAGGPAIGRRRSTRSGRSAPPAASVEAPASSGSDVGGPASPQASPRATTRVAQKRRRGKNVGDAEEEQGSPDNNTSSRATRRREAASTLPRLLLTGVTVSSTLQKAVKRLVRYAYACCMCSRAANSRALLQGAEITEDAEHATHVVAAEAKRTLKYLIGVSVGADGAARAVNVEMSC